MPVSPDILAALRRLDTTQPPLPDQYIARAPAGAARGWDLPGRLRVLLEAGQRVRAVLHGAIGVGKTTELYRWSQLLKAARMDAPVLDASRLTNFKGDNAQLVVRQLFNKVADPGSGKPAPRVVLLDGLDLLSSEAAEEAFGPGSALFQPGLPPVVYAAPHSVILQPPARRAPQIDQVWHLPPFAVLRADRTVDHAVVAHLVEGLARRLTGLNVLDDERVLRRVAIASGGVPRQAVRILRGALLAAAERGSVGPAHLLEGERELRQDLEAALEGHDADVLRSTWEGQPYRGDPRLVVSGAILPYEGVDPDRYWLPHPLLWSLFRPKEEIAALLNA